MYVQETQLSLTNRVTRSKKPLKGHSMIQGH